MFIEDPEPKDTKPQPAGQSLEQVIAEAERATTLAYRDQKPGEDARARRALVMRDALAHIPEHARHVKRADLSKRIKSRELFNAVDAWAWGDGPLVISGPTGVGKSSALAYLVRRLASEGIEFAGSRYEKALLIRWQLCAELCVAERESELGAQPEAIRTCQRARLLVLDELKSTNLREPLERVLWHRYDAGLPTVITTELNADQVEKHFGEAFLRRMSETAGVRGRWIVVALPEETPKTKGTQ